jgi:nucleoside-diphosphate-sugar epimerase
VLVIGGTGFLGRRIAEAFVQTGDHVAVLSRGARPAPEGVESLLVDRNDLDALELAVGARSFEVVVDNIAYAPEDVGNLLRIQRGRVGHYLMTSSAAVYRDRYVRRPLQESEADLALRSAVDAPNPFHSRLGHAYANAKRAAEQVLCATRDVPWTVLRPPVILGADDRTMRVWWFVQRLRDGGPIVIPDWGPGRMFQVAWAEDVARLFVLCAGNALAYGHAYNVAQAEIYTADTWIAACASALGVAGACVHVPEAELAARGLEGYALPVAGRPFGHVLLDLSAARRDVGFEPRPEAEWLQATIRGCSASPPEVNSAHYDRRAQELQAASAACRPRDDLRE